MLRNPIDMLYSLHSQFLFSGNEDIEDFGRAIAAEGLRAAGIQIPPTADFLAGLQYRQVARFSWQLARYLDLFGPEAVRVILFDEFVSETTRVIRNSFSFWG